MIDMKEMAHGTLFAVPLPDGSFLCGRVMLDIRGCLKRHLFPATSPLPGLGKAHLIEMYSAVTPVPEYVPSPLLVPGAFIESWEVGRSWPIIGHMPVDPKTVEFPESLIGFSHPGGGVAFECGEISIPLPLSYYDLMDRIAIFMGRHSAFLWPYTCLRAMGREKEVPVEYKTATLTDNDLRLSPHREEVYQYLPFAMADSYFQKQAQLGLHLERLYEYREEAEERRGSPAPRPKRKARDASLPEWVMRDVSWSFSSAPFADRAEFDAKVRQEQVTFGEGDTWQPDEVVIPCARIRVGYMCWEGDEQIEPVVEFSSDNGEFFTASELLFKIHNAVVEQLRQIDHHFFEGMSLARQPAPGEVPLYYLRQGS